ncbi:MAG TPA: phosphomannomutase/phosphoglucomutase [Stellaceae bacterium]|jgi:phosphomannomutase|nr:phosphomannomutase/phosphoglucomutase [Stellaceae bacterium]
MADGTVGYRFDPTILREYDIRGVIGETLHEADAHALGRSFAAVLVEAGGKSIAIGRDGRLSSPAIEKSLVAGLRESGIDVVRVGLGPTPMLYYAVHTLGVDAGIMVTGSHNPPTHNGFKLMLGKKPFFAGDIQRLGKIAAAGKFPRGAGAVREQPVLDDYVARLLKDYDGTRPLSVAWDAGNGATGEALQKLVATLPGKHLLLNEVIDGRFPAHHPDPTEPKNLVQLQDAVMQNGCDFGIAFDGDGDRIGMVDGKGRILWGDQFMVLMARDIVRTRPGATIIADVKASQVLFDEVERMGGKPLMWRTGHSLIKSKMAETGAPLAGEMSGHIFFADRYYGYDDALYAGVRILGILARGTISLAEFRDSLPAVVNTPELRFPCGDDRKFEVVEEVRARLEQAGASVSAIDGVRVKTKEGWWLLRASNTQDVLVARAEAGDAAGLETLKKLLVDQLRASGVAPPAF